MRVEKWHVRRCLGCKNSAVGAVNLWQGRDTFYVDCLRLARIPAGECSLFEAEDAV